MRHIRWLIMHVYNKEASSGILNFTRKDRITRGHNFKVDKDSCRLDVRKYYFSNRIVDAWNALPRELVKKKA